MSKLTELNESNVTYKVNGRSFKQYWQVKEYLDQRGFIVTDHETITHKGKTIVLYNVTSK